ncbi:MAG: helix-turn-helix domain-containing protein [Clostridium sp.]|nr:helix-turn-helix domain-containing protein [Clostridium sp.]
MEEIRYPVIDYVMTGKKLKAVCKDKNITAKELQRLLNLGSVQAVYNWFGGARLPNIDNLFAISKLLRVPMEDILVEGQKEAPVFARLYGTIT